MGMTIRDFDKSDRGIILTFFSDEELDEELTTRKLANWYNKNDISKDVLNDD